MATDDKKEVNKGNTFCNHQSKFSNLSKCKPSRHSGGYNVDKENNEPDGVQALKLLNNHYTAAIILNKYSFQKQSHDCEIHIFGKIAIQAKKKGLSDENCRVQSIRYHLFTLYFREM